MSALRARWASAVPRSAVVLHDLAMVWVCWHGLHYLRYSMVGTVPPQPWWSVEDAVVLLAQGVVLWQVGLYRGLWRFASVPDLWNLAKAGAFGLLAVVLGLFLYNRLDTVPRSVLLLYPFALIGLLGTPRLLYRAWKESHLARSDAGAVRVLILGAGRVGEALVRDLHRAGAYQPVGLLDDAMQLRGSKVQGVPVLGTIADVGEIARETAAKLLVIAMPSADATALQRVVAACEGTGLPFRMVPRLNDVLEGNSLPGQLKDVAIEDLLGRQPVLPDRAGDGGGWIDRLGTLPPMRPARRAAGHALGDRRARAGHHRFRTASRFPGTRLRTAARRLRGPGRHRPRAAQGRT